MRGRYRVQRCQFGSLSPISPARICPCPHGVENGGGAGHERSSPSSSRCVFPEPAVDCDQPKRPNLPRRSIKARSIAPQRQPPGFSLQARREWFSQTHPRPRQNGQVLSVTTYPASAAYWTCSRCALLLGRAPKLLITALGLPACCHKRCARPLISSSVSSDNCISSCEARPALGGMGSLEAGHARRRSAAAPARGFKR